MGLSQLLAASRSVRTIKDGPALYKMTQQNLLPRFGGEKPEITIADPAEVVAPVPARAPARVVPVVPVVAVGFVAEADRSNGSNGIIETDGTDVSAWRAARLARPTRAAMFVRASKKLRPFGGGIPFFKNPFRKLLARESQHAPMQAELLLDSVKPIRNDLSDSLAEGEREVVRRPETPPGPEPKAEAEVTGVVSRVGWWGRVKRRLFGGRIANRKT